MKKMSIITTVYNVEKYLRRCLDSLVNQTLDDIEIIVVNDASPDGSDIIMQAYAIQYPNLITNVFLKKNLGLGGARNKALEVAQGEYIVFVDSDDYIALDMCEKMYNMAKETDSDIVFCDFCKVDERTGKTNWFSHIFDQQMGDLTPDKIESIILVEEGYSCGKIMRRSIWEDNKIEFPEHMKYEDRATLPLVLLYSSRCARISEPLYYYILREGSITQSRELREYHYKKASLLLIERWKERGFYSDYLSLMQYVEIYGYLMEIGIMLGSEVQPDWHAIHNMVQHVKKRYPKRWELPYYYIKNNDNDIIGKEVVEYPAECVADYEKAFESGEFAKGVVGYEDYYEKGKEKLRNLLHELKKNGKVAIWGAGRKGTDFLKICDSDCCLVDYAFDKNENKWGTTLESGHLIADFLQAKNDVGSILVTNKNFYTGISHEVKEQNSHIKVINLDLYVIMGVSGEWKEYLD